MIRQQATLTGRKTRHGLAAAAALAALATAGLAACAAPAPSNPAQGEALRKLTEVAGGQLGAALPVSGTPGTDVLGTPLAAAAGDSDPVRATQAAADATQGIPDVRNLVKQQTPLATFTPDPAATPPAGRLVYVRNGKLYTAPAAGGQAAELAGSADLPAIWSPADDPGRAWAAPDGRHLLFFAGPDAEAWVMGGDGRGARRVSGPNLPSGIQSVTAGPSARQDIRFRPKQAYTLVYGAGEGGEPYAVLVDNNERHVKGQGRLRIVHAARGARDSALVATVNGAPIGGPIAFGRSSGDVPVASGPLQIELSDESGASRLKLAAIDLAERELKTVFITGDDKLAGTQYGYSVVTDPPSNASMVRVFNAGSAPLDASAGEVTLAKGLAPETLGSYATVAAPVSLDERQDLELGLYGLRPMESPVAWSPDGRRVAWLGAPEGQLQVFTSTVEGEGEALTSDERVKLNPVWSPDGRALAWIEVDPTLDAQTIAVERDGQVTAVDMSAVKQAEGWAATAPLRFPNDITWVDDSRLFFYPVSERTPGGVWLLDTRDGSLTQVSKEPVAQPDWSPVAKAWVFGRQQGEGELIVQPLDGEARTLPVRGRYPRWLPDGQRISWIEGEATATDGWAIHVLNADGSGDRDLTGKLPLVQADPPVPGPNPKRFWLDGGRLMGFTVAGTDYGAREEAGFGRSEAGADIENLWVVPVDGSAPPRRVTDLMKVFYLKELAESPDAGALAFVAFAYDSRSQQLYALNTAGGKPVQVDSGVRWFAWLPGAGQ